MGRRVVRGGRVELELVQDRDGKHLWNEDVDRYHALGYRQPMGCFLRYFIRSEAGLLGCVLMAGAAQAIRVRDQWIDQSTPKLIYVKALADDSRERLCGGPLPRRVKP